MAKKSFKEQVFGAEDNSAASIDREKLSRFQRIAARMYHTPQLSAKEVLWPALAKGGRNLSDMVKDTYRVYFFVSVLRLDMVYVTLIAALIAVYDVLNNPLMGIVYDRTRTRWGKARPYVSLASVVYFGSTALLFCGRLFFDNDVTDDPGKILFVFVILFLQETFSTIFAIPFDNMPSLQSPNPKDRMSVGLWQTYAHKWCGDFIAAMILPLLNLSKEGWIPVSPGIIFAFMGFFSAALGISSSLAMGLGCRERILLQPKPAPVTKTIFYILKNKYALRQFLAGFLGGWWNKGGYSWDVVTQLEIFGGVVRGAPAYIPRQVMQIVSLGFVERFKKMFHGRYAKTVVFMRMWDFIFGMTPAIIGLKTKTIGTWWKAVILFGVFDGIVVSNDAPSTVLENEIGREIGDYTEYMTGERPDGTGGLLTGFVGKLNEPLKALWQI
ncbi:MAG: MFS transporter, partial [Oscillospiraceae bacterium]|nr:MFS transporter [Oscillospiraceae bacterium]